ncbi:MAG: 50S ribosomal protein L24 [Acidobacteria bacterium]|nr:50S ribosomal protein L24 [Acidobacteriota bacterium]
MRLKKDDMVKVIAGKDKGKTGKIVSVDRDLGRVIVEGINMIKRATKPNPAKGIKGGFQEREASIHVSNVMILTSGGIATRIGSKVETVGGKTRRTRIARKTGEVLDSK